MGTAGLVREIWRHPVKSMQGTRIGHATVAAYGVVGDRQWAVRDAESGAVLSAKRHPRLLELTADVVGEGVTIAVPGLGTVSGAAANAAVSDFLGRCLALDVARPDGPAFVDAADLHLLATSALGAWDVRRFRPNLLLDTDLDLDDLLGERLSVGGVRLEVTKRTKRCSMTTAPQPGLPKDVGVLRTLARERQLCQGVYATVVSGGRIAVGDELRRG